MPGYLDLAEHRLWVDKWVELRNLAEVELVGYFQRVVMSYGGEGEIRTHGTREGTTVFETVPIDHSGTSPRDAGV